jgi:hypothetical protein
LNDWKAGWLRETRMWMSLDAVMFAGERAWSMPAAFI